MRIAIGLPTAIPNTPGHTLVAWARQAEALGFSSLGTIGRTVFDSYEELIVLAAAAGATRRIGLVTTVMIAPPREPVMLAKQAATLDALSGGRLALGLGIGWRDDDFKVVGADFSRRARTVQEQIATMRAVWEQQIVDGASAPVGPRPSRPGGPPILLCGRADSAIRRSGRLSDGFVAAPASAEDTRAQFDLFTQAWRAAGRKGKPRFAASRYFALGQDVAAEADANVRAYYEFGGEDFVRMIQGSLLRTPGQIREAIESLASTGAEELFLWPTVNRLDQAQRLAEVAM